jgi:protein KRI1
MPTHFRYVPVAKTQYGLSASEILLADDKDLNEYVGLKKLAPYRKQRDTWDAQRGERIREFKKKVSARLEETGANDATMEHLVDGEHKAKKRKGKKERMREKAARVADGTEVVPQEVETKTTDSSRKSNKRAKEQSEDVGEDMGITASSEPVKKKRRRQKKPENTVKKAVN